MLHTYRRLGELLVARSAISPLQLAVVLADQKISKRRLGEIVVERGYTTEQEVATCIAHQYNYAVIDLSFVTPEKEAFEKLTPDQALALRALPIHMNAQTLVCAISDPIDVTSTDKLAAIIGCPLTLQVAPERLLLSKIRSVYGIAEQPPTVAFDEGKLAPKRFTDLASIDRIGPVCRFDAMDSRLERPVSLIAIRQDHADADQHDRMVRSASNGPIDGLAAVHEALSHEGFQWTVTERLGGESLKTILEYRGARSVSQATALVSRVAETVDKLQRRGACGAWVGPSNVLIRASGPLIVPLAVPPQKYRASADAMPGSSAVFALGRLLEDCFAGMNPRLPRTEIPEPLERLIAGFLGNDVEHRFHSAVEVASALRSFEPDAEDESVDRALEAIDEQARRNLVREKRSLISKLLRNTA